MGLDYTYMKENILEMVENHKQTGGDHYAYLYNEKNRWDTQNTGKDAVMVSKWFDNNIMQEINNQLEKINTPKEKLIFINSEKNKFNKHYYGNSGRKLDAFFKECKDDIRSEIETKKKTAKPKRRKQITYQWFGKPEKIIQLHKMLLDYNLIPNDYLENDFKVIFTGQPTKNIKTMQWLATNRLLVYMLINLPIDTKNWQSVAGNGELFKNAAGKILNANDLSQAYNEGVKICKPIGHEKIDLIIKAIQNH